MKIYFIWEIQVTTRIVQEGIEDTIFVEHYSELVIIVLRLLFFIICCNIFEATVISEKF